jgi:hypothetical protein
LIFYFLESFVQHTISFRDREFKHISDTMYVAVGLADNDSKKSFIDSRLLRAFKSGVSRSSIPVTRPCPTGMPVKAAKPYQKRGCRCLCSEIFTP